jgi:uncharacterized membrane protein YeaQ/YmgE (transglycosylase-associated protein family)
MSMSVESILVWIVLGLIVGFIASRLMGAGGYGIVGDIVVGILGAIIGGWLAVQFLGIDVTGINLTSIAIGIVGAVILIAVYRALTPSRRGLSGMFR